MEASDGPRQSSTGAEIPLRFLKLAAGKYVVPPRNAPPQLTFTGVAEAVESNTDWEKYRVLGNMILIGWYPEHADKGLPELDMGEQRVVMYVRLALPGRA